MYSRLFTFSVCLQCVEAHKFRATFPHPMSVWLSTTLTKSFSKQTRPSKTLRSCDRGSTETCLSSTTTPVHVTSASLAFQTNCELTVMFSFTNRPRWERPSLYGRHHGSRSRGLHWQDGAHPRWRGRWHFEWAAQTETQVRHHGRYILEITHSATTVEMLKIHIPQLNWQSPLLKLLLML